MHTFSMVYENQKELSHKVHVLYGLEKPKRTIPQVVVTVSGIRNVYLLEILNLIKKKNSFLMSEIFQGRRLENL